MGMTFDEILQVAVKNGASDIHIRVGLPPMFRVNGSFLPLRDAARIEPEEAGKLASSVMSKIQRDRFNRQSELATSYGVKGLGRFRVNVFRQRMTVAMAVRSIPARIATFEELRLPRALNSIAEERSGLVLVTGPAACGKTTSLASLVDHVNGLRGGHILTIEDPIEFMYRDKRCIISQREVGVDTPDYASALRCAPRQDPDVIAVGELPNDDTIQAALTAAEGGRLVLGTMATPNAEETIHRLTAAFPKDNDRAARHRIAQTLRAIVSQRLIHRPEGAAVLLLTEVLVNNDKIRDLVADPDRIHELPDALNSSADTHGTQTFDQSVFSAFRDQLITQDEALRYCRNPDHFALQVAASDTTGLWQPTAELDD